MTRITRIPLAMLAISIAVSAFGIHALAQTKKPTAVAEIMLANVKETKGGFAYDVFTSNVELLRSREIAERAVKHGNLDQLASMKGKDAVSMVEDLLIVERAKDGINTAFKLGVTSVPGGDGVSILTAVIASYIDYVDGVHKNLSEHVKKDFSRAADDLDKRIRTADAEYRECQKETPVAFAKVAGGTSAVEKEHSVNAEYLAKVVVDQRDVTARLKALSDASQRPETAEAVKIKAREWGKIAGLEKNEATVEAYLSSMRLDLIVLAKRHELLQQHQIVLAEQLRELSEFELKVEKLRVACLRSRELFKDVQKKVQEAEFKSDSRVRVRIVTKPHIVE